MKALLGEIWIAVAMGLLAWAGIALLTNESIIDDWLVAVAQQSADQHFEDTARDAESVGVGVILIDDDALREEFERTQNNTGADRIASAYRTISSRILEIAQSDGSARAVVLDFYASPLSDVAPPAKSIAVDCRLPIIQVALPPPSPFGQEFVQPDSRLIDPRSPCLFVAYSFANQGADTEKLRTVEHNPVPQALGCPVISLSASAFALANPDMNAASGLNGQPCQRQQALRELCTDLPSCKAALQKRMPLTEPPENLSVRLANDFFDPALSDDARQWLENRLVFVGSSNTQSDDFYYLADGSIVDALSLTAQPSGIKWPGVVVHAGLTQRLLQTTATGTAGIQYLDWKLNFLIGAIVAGLTAFFDKRISLISRARRIVLWVAMSTMSLLVLALILANFIFLIVNFVLALFVMVITALIMWIIWGDERASITA